MLLSYDHIAELKLNQVLFM